MERGDEEAEFPGVGILNDGCTCYVGAVMQVLTHIGRLCNLILEMYPETSRGRAVQNQIEHYFNNMTERIKYMRLPDPKIYKIFGFGNNFSDAAEFYIAVVSSLFDDCSEDQGQILDELLRIGLRKSDQERHLFCMHTTFDYFCIEDMITTELEWEIDDMAMTALKSRKKKKIHDCDSGSKSGSDPGGFEEAGVLDESECLTDFVRLPIVLTFVFCPSEPGETASKAFITEEGRKKEVLKEKIPLTNLHLVDNTGMKSYELFALIIHTGQITKGHYEALIKMENTWHKFNDSQIRPVSDEYVQKICASGSALRQRVVMAFYVMANQKEILTEEVSIMKVEEDLLPRKLITHQLVWVSVLTNPKLNPWRLMLEGDTDELAIHADTTVNDLYKILRTQYMAETDDNCLHIWSVVDGKVTSPLHRSDKLVSTVYAGQTLLIAEGDFGRFSTLGFVVAYMKNMPYNERVAFLGMHAISTRERIHAVIQRLYPTISYDGLWVAIDRLEPRNLKENQNLLDHGISISSIVIIETRDVGIEPFRMQENDKFSYYVPNPQDVQEFYRVYANLFRVNVEYGLTTYRLELPASISWKSFSDICASSFGIKGKIQLFRDHKGTAVTRSLPPIHLSELTVYVVEMNHETQNDSVSNTKHEEEEEHTEEELGSALPQENVTKELKMRKAVLQVIHPRTNGVTLHPVRSRGSIPVVTQREQTPIESLLSLLQSRRPEATVIYPASTSGDPSECPITLQQALNALRNKQYESSSAAMMAYSSVVKIGPLLRSDGIHMNDEQFRCLRPNCGAHLHLQHHDKYCEIVDATPHRCVSKSTTSSHIIDEYIRRRGKQNKLGSSFMDKVRIALDDEFITDQRIRRSYQRVWELTVPKRLKSWSRLSSLCDEIVRDGGTSSLIGDGDSITFCGIMPSFCHTFVKSAIFFPVVSIDGSFQCGIGRGQLLAIVALTGERTIFPVAWGWGDRENKQNVTALINLFTEKERELIKTVISDEGTAIIAAVCDSLSPDHYGLCLKHKEQYVPAAARHTFWKLGKAETLRQYKEAKFELQEKFPEAYAKIGPLLKHLSRWEMSGPRDHMTTNGIAESLNAMCKDLKSSEPLELLHHIYTISRAEIIKLGKEKNTYTEAASRYISSSVQMSQRLDITTKYPDGTYIIRTNEDEFQVDLVSNSCSCKLLEDCGLPCSHIIAAAADAGTSWESLIHPRYKIGSIREVFPEPPGTIDFTGLMAIGEKSPPTIHDMKCRKKRGRGAMDKGKR